MEEVTRVTYGDMCPDVTPPDGSRAEDWAMRVVRKQRAAYPGGVHGRTERVVRHHRGRSPFPARRHRPDRPHVVRRAVRGAVLPRASHDRRRGAARHGQPGRQVGARPQAPGAGIRRLAAAHPHPGHRRGPHFPGHGAGDGGDGAPSEGLAGKRGVDALLRLPPARGRRHRLALVAVRQVRPALRGHCAGGPAAVARDSRRPLAALRPASSPPAARPAYRAA